jgi:CrcB protein
VEVRFPIAWPDEGPDRRELTAVFVGGAIGAVVRAELEEHLVHGAGGWPWATFLVNLAGAALLGWVLAREARGRLRSSHTRPFVGAGMCGALTTFSTFQLELYTLLDGGHAATAAGYAAASIVLGLVAVRAGATVGRR